MPSGWRGAPTTISTVNTMAANHILLVLLNNKDRVIRTWTSVSLDICCKHDLHTHHSAILSLAVTEDVEQH